MSTSPVIARRRIRRPPRRFRGRNRTPKRATVSTVAMMAIRARMPAIRYALVVTAAWLIATGTYFVFQDDVLTRLFGLQTKIQMSGLFLDQKQVEQQFITLLQRQATLEQTLANMPAWPESGVIDTVPQMSPIETPSAPAIVAVAHEEHAKKVEQAIIRGKEPRHRKHARVARKRTHEVPIITVGHTADAEPFGQLNSY